METLWKDVRFALRMLRRTPGVAAAAVVALALGIGANTAIFSVVDGVLLRPLPYRDSQALVTLSGLVPALEQRSALSYPEFKDILAQSRTLANAGVYESVDANLTGGGGAPMRISAGLASATLLPTLGVEPLLGRNFTADEERRGGDDAALLDFALWQSRFAGNANVVGQTILVDNQPYRIVGVLPRGFQIGGRCDLWLPLSTSREDVAQRGSHWLKLVART
ncbi:MAG TPA: ABC transporter permease, partial [Polyangia bacterium]